MAEMSEGAIKISWSEWQAQRAAKRAALAAYGLSGESRRTTARPEARRALQAFRVGNRVVRSLSCAVALVLAAGNVPAGTWHLAGTELARIDASADRNPSPLKVDMARIGTLSYARDKDWLKTDLASRNGVPGDDFVTRPAMFEWEGAPLKEPVWVDLFTGAVYAIPAKRQLVHSCGVSFVCIPVYDSPCLVTERAALSLLAPEGPRAVEWPPAK